MKDPSNNVDLIELINSTYFTLRKTREELWGNSHNLSITNSEWYILSLIYGKQPTISEIAQQINISRQAAHKSIKTLNTKGLILINNVQNNNRNKCLKLTPLGETCFLENKQMKETIESNIESKIGSDNVTLLKTLLQKEWN